MVLAPPDAGVRRQVEGVMKTRYTVVLSMIAGTAAQAAERLSAWTDPPKRVAITEWDSLDQAEAFFKSKAWTDLGPDRDKAIRTIRRYAVEAVN